MKIEGLHLERLKYKGPVKIYQHLVKDNIMVTPLKVVKNEGDSPNVVQMVKAIACALVDQPDAVSVSEINGTHSLIIELKVAKEDLGKIIGKQGRNVSAIRAIVSAVSGKIKKHTVLEIIE